MNKTTAEMSEEGQDDDDYGFRELLPLVATGDEPSPFGRLTVKVSGSPASVQSSGRVREEFIKQIRSQISRYKFILIGDVFLDITWHVSNTSRYETDARADLDNCLKPILDAFTGPDGLLVDDCQIRGLYIAWTGELGGEERVEFDFKFEDSHFVPKQNIGFVAIDNIRRIPVSLSNSQGYLKVEAALLQAGIRWRKALEDSGLDVDNFLTTFYLGVRPFHVSRIQRFKTVTPKDLRGTNAD